jgi:predicted ester cyclase
MGLDEVELDLDALVQGGKLTSLTLSATEASSRRLVAAIPLDAKAAVRRFIEQVNRKNMAVLDETTSHGFVQHSIMPVGPGRQGLKDFYKSFRGAFPDFQFTIDDMIAEGDQVAVRMTCRYTHKGEFMGIAPTGKAVVVTKMDIFRVVNGKVVEHWDAVDRLGLLQQLGVVPKIPQWTASPTSEGFR